MGRADRLPAARAPARPAGEPRELPDIERIALAQRLDVQGARLAVEQTASNLGLTRATRFINVLELGLRQQLERRPTPARLGDRLRAAAVRLGHGARRPGRERSTCRRCQPRGRDRHQRPLRSARSLRRYRSAWDIASHQRDEIVPLRQRIAEENLLRYNGMLIGVFELLADARAQIASVNGAIDALRDFWLAQSDLDMALVGKPSLAAAALPATAAPPAGGAGH